MNQFQRVATAILSLGLVVVVSQANRSGGQPPRVPIDPDEAAERRIMTQRAIRDNCLICHGEEMFTSQRLTPKQWKAEVEKMVGWGAPLPPELHADVIDHLAAEYSDRAAPYAPGSMTIAAAWARITPEPETHGGPAPSAEKGQAPYATHCANCHGEDGQGAELGPNLVEKPVLYREIDYRSVVREGLNRMPGFAAVLKPDVEAAILAWLRERRYRPTNLP